MGRAKREMKRIENAASRNVCFSKRRRGLLKKAQELSILCDASVGVVVFSANGKLFEYSSTFGMQEIIEKYMKFPGHERVLTMDDITEATGLHRYHQMLEHEYRQMNGEDLGDMNFRELEELEDLIERGLKRVKLRQCELYNNQMAKIQLKGMELVEEHAMLRQQLKALRPEQEEAADEAESQFQMMAQYEFL